MKEKQRKLADAIYDIIDILGIEATYSNEKTPERVAKMWVTELFKGLDPERRPCMTTFPNEAHDEMIVIKDIAIYSTCEHHLVPFIGTCSIGYIPNKHLLGLSKFNRIVDYLASKPTLQEKLTKEIHDTLCAELEIKDVAVSIKATHFCVKIRGIKDQNSETITNALTGKFRLPEVRAEFLNSIR